MRIHPDPRIRIRNSDFNPSLTHTIHDLADGGGSKNSSSVSGPGPWHIGQGCTVQYLPRRILQGT
jgi:hypothetical protein